jgi:hypothetical protein
MLATAGVAPYANVIDLSRRMRCRECDEKGRALVTIGWGRYFFGGLISKKRGCGSGQYDFRLSGDGRNPDGLTNKSKT